MKRKRLEGIIVLRNLQIKNKLAQLSPYDIEQFIMLLIFRFKPKDRLNKIEEVEEDEIEISETS